MKSVRTNATRILIYEADWFHAIETPQHGYSLSSTATDDLGGSPSEEMQKLTQFHSVPWKEECEKRYLLMLVVSLITPATDLKAIYQFSPSILWITNTLRSWCINSMFRDREIFPPIVQMLLMERKEHEFRWQLSIKQLSYGFSMKFLFFSV